MSRSGASPPAIKSTGSGNSCSSKGETGTWASAPRGPDHNHDAWVFGGLNGPARHAAKDRDRKEAGSWDDVPLKTKLVLLLLLATLGGGLIAMGDAYLGHQIWRLGAAVSVLLFVMVWLGHIWVCRPFDRLIRQLRRIGTVSRPDILGSLALQRRDEVGQVAKAVHGIATSALHDRFEAKHLRRTLDHRVASATHKATSQLRKIAMRDPLTNLGNRLFLEENLEPLVQSVLDSEGDVICLLIDMDNLKNVNDTLGHAAGDGLIKFLASLLLAITRRNDYAIRLGGDEFVVLLPNCSRDRVRSICEQLLSLFRQHVRMAYASDVRADLSMGAASLQRDCIRNGEELMARADANMYAAKEAGKGQAYGISWKTGAGSRPLFLNPETQMTKHPKSERAAHSRG